MEKIKIKKNWTNAEVENYTKKLMSSSEISLAEQRDRIAELKRQNEKLTREIAEVKSKEKMISSALTEATKKSIEVEQITKAKAALEIEKVKQFSYKWTNYFDELAQNHPELAGKNIKKMFKEEVKGLIDQIFESNNFRTSVDDKVLQKKPKLSPMSASDIYISEIKKSSDIEESTLSPENEQRFNEIITKIKSRMIHSNELTKPSEEGFNIEEALNPKDSLDKILDDLL